MTTRVSLECDLCHSAASVHAPSFQISSSQRHPSVEERRPKLVERLYGMPDGWTEHGTVPGLPIANADMHHCADCQPKCSLC